MNISKYFLKIRKLKLEWIMTTTSFMLATILNITPKERFLSSKVKSNSFKREDGYGFTIDADIW